MPAVVHPSFPFWLSRDCSSSHFEHNWFGRSGYDGGGDDDDDNDGDDCDDDDDDDETVLLFWTCPTYRIMERASHKNIKYYAQNSNFAYALGYNCIHDLRLCHR